MWKSSDCTILCVPEWSQELCCRGHLPLAGSPEAKASPRVGAHQRASGGLVFTHGIRLGSTWRSYMGLSVGLPPAGRYVQVGCLVVQIAKKRWSWLTDHWKYATEKWVQPHFVEIRKFNCHTASVWEQNLRLISLWCRSGGSGVLSPFFSCCQRLCIKQAACHTRCKLPWCPHASFSLLALLNHNPLSWRATSVLTTPGTLSPCCHWISSWLQRYILCFVFILCPHINGELSEY